MTYSEQDHADQRAAAEEGFGTAIGVAVNVDHEIDAESAPSQNDYLQKVVDTFWANPELGLFAAAVTVTDQEPGMKQYAAENEKIEELLPKYLGPHKWEELHKERDRRNAKEKPPTLNDFLLKAHDAFWDNSEVGLAEAAKHLVKILPSMKQFAPAIDKLDELLPPLLGKEKWDELQEKRIKRELEGDRDIRSATGG